jgi:hypothetical protein
MLVGVDEEEEKARFERFIMSKNVGEAISQSIMFHLKSKSVKSLVFAARESKTVATLSAFLKKSKLINIAEVCRKNACEMPPKI